MLRENDDWSDIDNDWSGPNGDWSEYVDEYGTYGHPGWPGIAILDQGGNFIDVRAYPGANYDANEEIDWVARTIDRALGGRQPVNIVLALDRSGSMGSLAPSGLGMPKIDVLRDAVGVFLDVWQANPVTADQVGVVDFSQTIAVHPLAPLAGGAGSVRSYIGNLNTGGWTCMGGAVATALDQLAGLGRAHIILFSDGMQNINPVLADATSYSTEIIHVEPGDIAEYELVTAIHGDSGIPGRPDEALRDAGTTIHSIGVGLSGAPWSDLMSRVSADTDGLFFETPAPEEDLQNFYVNALLEAFEGATPQLARHTRGTYLQDEGSLESTCHINTSARWLTVVLSWSGDIERGRLLCNLEAPDGTLIEIHSRTRAAPRRRVISIPLPTFNHDRVVRHEGQWRLHVMGTSDGPVPYQVFWIVDDPNVHFEVPGIARRYSVGDKLQLRARLLQGEKPTPTVYVRNAVVNVASPRIDLGEFIRDYPLGADRIHELRRDIGELRHGSDDDLKLHALSQDGVAVANLTRPDVRVVPLEYQQAEFMKAIELDRPGLHRLDLEVKALDEKGHLIVRQRTINLWVQPTSTMHHISK